MANPNAVNGGHIGVNQDLSITGVIGTLGTADVGGTAQVLPFGVDPATGAMYVNILAGAGAASNPTAGTLNTLGTVGTILGIGGTVQVSGASAGTNVNIVTGSLVGTVSLNSSGTILNLAAGTVTAVNNIVTGTIAQLTSQNAGTLNTLGTVGTVLGVGGVVQMNQATGTINTGTVQVSAGTVVGTFLELTGSVTGGTADIIASTDVSNYRWADLQIINTWVGTINPQFSNDNSNFVGNNLMAINSTSSFAANITANGIYRFPIEGRYLRVRMNAFTSGTAQGILELYSVSPAAQNQPSQLLVSQGSINVTAGTITAGTVQSDMRPVNAGTSINVVGTAGASLWGTVVTSPGNGIKNYVAGVDIVVTTGTVEVAVTQIGIGGSTGAGVLARGAFPAGGGISKSFNPLQVSGTGGTIAYWMGGAGTANITVQYAQGA